MEKTKRKVMEKECVKMFVEIMDSKHPDRTTLADTTYGYKGVKNMTDEELEQNYVEISDNWLKMMEHSRRV
jgi:hypothetical protein